MALRRKLYSLRLREGDSVHKACKGNDRDRAAGDPVKEEDRVISLLASLHDPYNMLVTALEANAEVPKMEIVPERLLHEKSKLKQKVAVGIESETMAMTGQHRWKGKGPKCRHCDRFGHIRQDCRELTSGRKDSQQRRIGSQNTEHTMRR